MPDNTELLRQILTNQVAIMRALSKLLSHENLVRQDLVRDIADTRDMLPRDEPVGGW